MTTKTNKAVSEVDPATEFGNLGSVIIPAHGTVSLTLTFPVSDAVADPTANQDVALH